MKKEIDWLKEYEALRLIHQDIKSITRERPEGFKWTPFWGVNRKVPKKYAEILWQIDDLLYDAEEYVVKKGGI